MDDFWLAYLAHQTDGENFHRYNLFNFASVFKDVIKPWFANEGAALVLFRPVSSVLFLMDYTLFGDNYWAWHLHSILWGVVLLTGAWCLFHLTLPKEVANLATIILSCSFFISWSIIWLSQRNHMIALAPGVWALYWYIKWRTEAWKPGYPLTIAGVSMGLLAAEYGLCILGFFLAFEVSQSRFKVRRLLWRLWPFGVVLVAYLAFYRMVKASASGISDYVSPFSDPMRYYGELPEKLMTLLGFLFGNPIHQSVNSLSNWVLSIIFILLGLCSLWVIINRQDKESDSDWNIQSVKWYFAGTLLSLLPVTSAAANSRLLSCAAMGFSVMASVIVFGCLSKKIVAKRPLWVKIYSVYLLVFCVLLSPGSYVGASLWFKGLGSASEEAFHDSLGNIDLEKTKNVVLVRSPVNYPYIFLPTVFKTHGITSFDYTTLTVTRKPFALKVLDPYTIEIEIQKELLAIDDRGFHQPKRVNALAKEDEVKNALFSVRFIDSENALAKRVRFVFNVPIHDAGIQFMNWENNRLTPLTLPQPGGEPLFFEPYTLGAFGVHI